VKKKPTLTWQLFTIGVFVYHLAALVKDAERCAYNARRVRDHPSLANLAKFLVADGVLVADLGSI
jgi:hypothetical protein